MKYTIINSNTRTPFIQQIYGAVEEAKERLRALKEKFADCYPFAIVLINDAGDFFDVSNKTPNKLANKQEPDESDSQNRSL